MATHQNALQIQINALKAEVAAQQAKKQAASVQLASDPSNTTTLAAIRSCNDSLRTLAEDIDMLEGALSAAAVADNTEEVAAKKREAIAHLNAADKLHGKRITAGKAVDAALLNLEKAIQSWISISGELSDEAFEFYRITLSGNPRWDEHVRHLRADLVNAGNNSIACQVAEACTGLNTNHHLAMNFIRDSPTMRESVEKDAKKYGERMIAKLHNTAESVGLVKEKDLA